MQKILFQINNTGPNPVIYMKTQLHGAGCTQLFIHILTIDRALLWAVAADPELEAPLVCRGWLGSLPPSTAGAIWEQPRGIHRATAQLIHWTPTSQLQPNSSQNQVRL